MLTRLRLDGSGRRRLRSAYRASSRPSQVGEGKKKYMKGSAGVIPSDSGKFVTIRNANPRNTAHVHYFPRREHETDNTKREAILFLLL